MALDILSIQETISDPEPDKLQEMINTDLAAIERWYDADRKSVV